MNSIWLVITAVAAFVVAYRFYGAFLATKVAMLNDRNITPAHRLEDGVDYHPTKRLVLFGVHFAAIAGAGPLVGPVLASQWGYFPGFCWIVIGSCLAGGVHDFVVLVASVRNQGLSLPKIARNTIGPVAGATTAVATLFTVMAILASTAMVVVKALGESPWGVFTIVCTIPAALLTGLWMYKIRPGRVGEASIIGVTIVLAGVFFGEPFARSSFAGLLTFDPKTFSLILPTYAAIGSILPVWLLMCPRDYLSSYLKIGVIAVLTVGIFLVQPVLKMPGLTPFVAGDGPVVSGAVWPFVCIVIGCGALSGFHSLIASGTTPKMINRESDIRSIGYGAMLLEGIVALMALVAACSLEPGDYFCINAASGGDPVAYQKTVDRVQKQYAWNLSPKELPDLEKEVHEKLAGRTGGAVTLAVGMAKVFSRLPLMKQLAAYWYHFIIMFEALFILTLLETGTRVARFVFQETIAQFNSKYEIGRKPHWVLNITMSVVVCGLWGGLLYIGNLDTLWRMLGIANQLLATIALAVGTTYLLEHSPKKIYAMCAGVPFAFTFVTTSTAAVQSIQMWWVTTGGGPSETFMRHLACILAGIMLLLTLVITFESVRRWRVLLLQGKSATIC
jgi:carbon starvation protein